MNSKRIVGLGIVVLITALIFATITVIVPKINGFSNYGTYTEAKELGLDNGQDYETYLKIAHLAKRIGIANSFEIEVFDELNELSNPPFERRVDILQDITGLSDSAVRYGATLHDSDSFQNYVKTVNAALSLGFQRRERPKSNYTQLNEISNPLFPERVNELREAGNLSDKNIMDIATVSERKYTALVGIISQLEDDLTAQGVLYEHLEQLIAADILAINYASQTLNKLITDLTLEKRDAAQFVSTLLKELSNDIDNSSLRKAKVILVNSPFTSDSEFRAFLRNAAIDSSSLVDDLIEFDKKIRVDYVSEALNISRGLAENLDEFYTLHRLSRQSDYKNFVDWDGARALAQNALPTIMQEISKGNLSEYEDGAGQYKFCTDLWQTCEDNSDLANNYDGWTDASVACEMATENRARYGEPDWGGWFRISFGKFYSGDSYVRNGTAILIEDDVKLQNGFGAMVRSTVECSYDLEREEVLSIVIN